MENIATYPAFTGKIVYPANNNYCNDIRVAELADIVSAAVNPSSTANIPAECDINKDDTFNISDIVAKIKQMNLKQTNQDNSK